MKDFTKEELIAMQEMMSMLSPSSAEEATIKASLEKKLKESVGTPEERAAEMAGAKLDKCLNGLGKYFEEKNIVLCSSAPIFLKDLDSGFSVQIN